MQFWVSAPYFRNVVVESVAPTPSLVSVERERHVYTIRAGAPEVTVMLHVDHTTAGRIEAEVGLVGWPVGSLHASGRCSKSEVSWIPFFALRPSICSC